MAEKTRTGVSRRTLLVGSATLAALMAGRSAGISAAFAAEGGMPAMGGTLNVALWQGLQTLDWQSTTAHPVPHALTSVFEGLYALGSDLRPQPELAESYTVADDAMTWTFKLRQGVKFHNGQELTSADVQASIERWRKVSPSAGQLEALQEIATPDASTVVMKFNKPIGQFLLFVLGYDSPKLVVMPESIAKASPEGGKLTEVVGTGPYKIAEYQADNFLRLARFDGYAVRSDDPNYETGRKVAYTDEIIHWIVPEATTRVAGLETGEYHVIERVPDVEFARLKDEDGVDPVLMSPPVMSFIFFNNSEGSMFKDMNMRRAVQAAINCDEIAAAMVADPALGAAYPSIMAKGNAYYSDAGADLYNQNNIDKAKKYLEDAKYDGAPIRFLLLSSEDTISRAVVTAGAQLQRAGMNVKIETYDLGTWVAKRRDPSGFELFVTEGVQPDPLLWQNTLGGKWPGAEVGYNDDEMKAVLDKMPQEVDFDKRKALAEDMQRILYEKVVIVPLGWHFRLRAKRSEVIDPAKVLDIGPILTLNNVGLAKT